MPTRNVNLTPEQDAFVEEVVKAGRYQNASEAVRDAVHGLQQRLKADELTLEVLRTQLKAGIAALERGEFTVIEDAELDDAFDDPVRYSPIEIVRVLHERMEPDRHVNTRG